MPNIQQIHFKGCLQPATPDGRIGVITLATDLTLQRELPMMLPPTVEAFTNRVLNANPMTLENLRRMREDIARAAAGLLPGRGINAAIYACTSGAAAIGAKVIREQIQSLHPNIPVTNPLDALAAACESLGIKKLSILTPYIDEINQALATQCSLLNLDIININGLGFDDDTLVADIPPAIIINYARQTCHPQAQALFISCTAMRAAETIQAIEQIINKPVLTSNQLLAWHVARLLNKPTSIHGYGRLLMAV